MYLVEYGDPTDNTWIQVARWLAPIATASGLTLVFSSIGKGIRRIYIGYSKTSVAVFGTDSEKSALLRQLGINGISMESNAICAGSYILVGSEEENLEFYQHNADILKNKNVYLKCHSLPGQASNDPKLHLFSPEENATRLFWKEHCPLQLSQAANHRMKIAILGFGRLGKELIIQGLQYNIFDPEQIIEYHIWGEDDGFTDTHPQLNQITDPVVFHDEPWYKSKDLLAQCQMVIVAQQEQQLELLQGLTSLFLRKPIHVFVAQANGIALLDASTNIISFDWKNVSGLLESIRGTRMHYLAKKLNLRYAHLYSQVPESEDYLDSEWAKLNTFTRYSNISAANYHEVCMRILDGAELTQERLEFLGELEHIRWCRYHYLNNWKQGFPQNGKQKDPQNRIHALLVPDADLPEQEREKDRENIRILMSLQERES
jgi:hypothetical protein